MNKTDTYRMFPDDRGFNPAEYDNRRGRDTMTGTTAYGYDGTAYGVGDRVELHPGTDLWMRGARYGTVIGLSTTPRDKVRVQLDKVRGTVAGTADTFRRI